MKTTTFSVTTSDTAITTTVATKKVLIQEDPGVAEWPTTDYKIKMPLSTNTAIQRSSGTSFEFSSDMIIPAGKIVGYVATVSGTTTFQKLEQGL